MPQNTKRQSWVDFARGVAIILVCYRHVFEGIKSSGISVEHYMYFEYFNIMFFSFRMPLFFIVSGIFLSASFAKRGFAKYVENKARVILYPYFLWGAIQITLQIIFSKYANGQRTPHDYLDLLLEPNEIEQFWYLYALFNTSVLYVILKYILKWPQWSQIIIAIGMFYAAAVLHRDGINLGFVPDILHNYIFILIGDVVHRWIRNEKQIHLFQSWKFFFVLLIPFILTQVFFLYENLQHTGMKYRYVEYFQPFLFFVIALTGCVFVISGCFLLQRFDRPQWLKILGRYSLYIYVSHVIIFAAFRTFFTRVLHIENVPVLLVTGIFAGLTGPVILFKIAQRFRMEWLFTLEKSSLPNFERSNSTVSKPGTLN